MIPAAAKPDCTACAKSGGTYDMHCRECVGRWLRYLNSVEAGHNALQAWCKAQAKTEGRDAVAAFLRECGVRA